MAATVNVADCPAVTVWLAGCIVICGAPLPCCAEVTVRIAALLVALPTELLTTTVNLAALSALAAAGVVYELEVAPEMLTPFFCH